MKIEIADVRPEHVEGIQEVFYRAWLATYPNDAAGVTVDDVEDRFKERNSKERLAKRREDIASVDPDKRFLVALDGERVIGLARASKNEKENRLNAIYVLPEYQGKGVGTKLWNEIKSFFDPTKDVVVGVATYNEKAIGFYTKLGFIDSGRRYTEEGLRLKSGAILPEMDMVIRAE
jgi:ribosomal protein S18 acetylase RimI-like enzyme